DDRFRPREERPRSRDDRSRPSDDRRRPTREDGPRSRGERSPAMGTVIRMPRPDSNREGGRIDRAAPRSQDSDWAKKKQFSEKEGLPPSLGAKVRAKKESEAPSTPSAPKQTETAPAAVKASTPTPPPTRAYRSGTRLRLNIGAESGVTTGNLRDAILGETGLSSDALGKVDVQAKFATVEISSDQARSAVTKMKRASIGGKRVKAILLKS
ncbi:DbpA RNA binding domain-containing protein, partial [bacterium]|nr:DbpA RNA binding domain-containing protein [bacterium]